MQALDIQVKKTDNKPLNKICAYWAPISDMKTIKWGDAIEKLGLGVRGSARATLGRVVKQVVSGLRPDRSWESIA